MEVKMKKMAEAVLELTSEYPHAKLEAVVTCSSQSESWGLDLSANCNKISIISFLFYPHDCLFKRNRHIVDHVSLLIAVYYDNRGGEGYTVNYTKKGISINLLNP